MIGRLIGCSLLLVACATPKPPAYSEQCRDPAKPCAFSYDFEPSGIARDVFTPAAGQPAFLMANEDGLVFRWNLAKGAEWDHDHADFAFSLDRVLHKVESAASGVCDGLPVFLAASNFMPGRGGKHPKRERVVAIVGTLDAPPRILETVSSMIREIAVLEGVDAPKVEGLALSADCRTLFVGLRSVLLKKGEDAIRDEIYAIAIDIDWKGGGEAATISQPLVLETRGTCSGYDEGISSLEVLSDGSLLALTSYEVEQVAKQAPTDVAKGVLSGTLWRRWPDGRTERLACFPGHKPESVAVDPDERTARVVFEDDEYGGRPVQAFAVTVPLAK